MKFLIPLIAMFFVGCSTYTAPVGAKTASISFEMKSDSTMTTTQSFTISAFENLSCGKSKNGTAVWQKLFAGTHEKVEQVQIEAEKPFVFAILYNEARFAQNRGCTFTASFSPIVGRTYKALFESVNQSLGCGIQVFDDKNDRVAISTPEDSCMATMAGQTKNGGAGIVNWVINSQKQ